MLGEMMWLEDGIVYWERRGRHKCGNA